MHVTKMTDNKPFTGSKKMKKVREIMEMMGNANLR